MASSFVDPATLMRIRSLQLRSRRAVEGFYNGLHRSPYHGFSVEFSQYRPYAVGDDPRGLDWKLFARSDRYHIKQFEDETSRRCYLVVDQSRSMEYGTLSYNKAEYARTVAATLAYYLTLQRDSVGLLTFGDDVLDFLPARHRPGHFRQILASLERSAGGTRTDLRKPLERIAAMVRRRGLVILLSDLLAPVDALKTHLAHLRGRGHEILLLRVLDPGELELRLDEPAMVHDLESGRDIYIDPDAARDTYRRRFDEHQKTVQAACDALGVFYSTLVTDQPVDSALFDLLSMTVRRNSGRTAR